MQQFHRLKYNIIYHIYDAGQIYDVTFINLHNKENKQVQSTNISRILNKHNLKM